MKTWFYFLTCFFTTAFAFAQNPFITTWKTDNPGPSDDYTIVIPLAPESVYNFEVDWGDGNTAIYSGIGSAINVSHSYAVIGTYTVSIDGMFPRIFFNEFGDSKDKILNVEQWGNIVWESFESSFSGCHNLQILASDAPNLSQVISLRKMFYDATNFNESIDFWDVSNVSIMSEMFELATSFNQPLNSWDVSNVSTMNRMFKTATSFNQLIDSWNTSNVIDMSDMFSNAISFNQPINAWDVSNVINMKGMFSNASAFNQSLDQWNVSNVTNMSFMFSHLIDGDSNFDQPLNSWDVSSVTDMNSMFAFTNLFNQSLNNWDVSNVNNMTWMFRNSFSFNQSINDWDVSNVTNLYGIFWGAEAFNQPLCSWDVGSVTNFSFAFRENQIFNQSLGNWNMTNATDVSGMLNSSSLSPCKYDSTLIGWSQQILPINLQLGALGLQYTQIGADAKQSIIDNYGWQISGDFLIVVPSLNVTSEVNDTEISVFASEGLGEYNYFWSGPNGFTSNESSIVAPQNGLYTVIVTDGCETWSDSFEVLTVQITDSEKINVQIFPNPSTGFVQIVSPSAQQLALYDQSGRMVHQSKLIAGNQHLDISYLVTGVYSGKLMSLNGDYLQTVRVALVR